MWKNRTDRDPNPDSALHGLYEEIRRIAGIERPPQEPTVTVATADMCVAATVDGRGHLVGLQFSPGIEKLTYDEIAERVLTTARQAVVQVARLDA
ncbi:hypothetical protein [Nocardia sp. NBC_00416]|uniref:hypothetical protein n=1 Tax=Nocardia sp. NBC_00416 TaxID=2975991 RepID=UPI002E1BE1F6